MPIVYINNNTPVDATGKVLIVYQDTGYEDVIDIHDELFYPLNAHDYAPGASGTGRVRGFRQCTGPAGGKKPGESVPEYGSDT